MKGKNLLIAALALVVGFAAGALVYRAVFVPSGMMHVMSLVVSNPQISNAKASQFFGSYYADAPITESKFKGMMVDVEQAGAILNMAKNDASLTTFRIYPGKDDAGKKVALIVAVDGQGKDIAKDNVVLVAAKQLDPCPPICDVSSPIMQNIP